MTTRWLAGLLAGALTALAQDDLAVLKDLRYRAGDDLTAYEAERCKLDLTLPKPGGRPFATYVWFYGGGLKNGGKDLASEHCAEIARSFAREGIAVAVPDYRLNPRAKYPDYVDDAAAAFAWTVRNIARHGGDPRQVFIGGHSAGGYLALLVGFDESRLRPYGLGLKDVAGIAQVSGQVFTHYTVREERGLSRYATTADEAARVLRAQSPAARADHLRGTRHAGPGRGESLPAGDAQGRGPCRYDLPQGHGQGPCDRWA